MRLSGPAVAELWRYGVALAGPVGVAGAQFALSLVLVRQLDPVAFGRFSFLLVAAQLSWGVWSAIFCAPLPQLIAPGGAERAPEALRGTLTANLLGVAAGLPLFAALALALGERGDAALLFAAFGAVALLRWFGRAYAYAIGRPLRAAASDLTYAVLLGVGVVAVALLGWGSTRNAFALLAVATVVGLVPFGRGYLTRQLRAFRPSSLAAYRPTWRDHARWSMSGVLTAEATANAHSYLVTLLIGPTAFAPVAASALLVRPTAVAGNAFTEFERPRLAEAARDGDGARVDTILRQFARAMWLAWLATAVAIVVVMAVAPRLIFPPHYAVPMMATGAALWMVSAGARMVRTPAGTLLQAVGAFRPLALASLWSSLVSLAAVALLLAAAPPLWTIAGVALGEIAGAVLILREARRWRGGARRDALAYAERVAPPVVEVAAP
jgi:O-antigen/teichoic acid export membrane protein